MNVINKNRIVFKMNVFNSFDVNSIKNEINKKCQTSLWKSTQINNLLSCLSCIEHVIFPYM